MKIIKPVLMLIAFALVVFLLAMQGQAKADTGYQSVCLLNYQFVVGTDGSLTQVFTTTGHGIGCQSPV